MEPRNLERAGCMCVRRCGSMAKQCQRDFTFALGKWIEKLCSSCGSSLRFACFCYKFHSTNRKDMQQCAIMNKNGGKLVKVNHRRVNILNRHNTYCSMKKIYKVRHKRERINFSTTKDRALKSFWGCFNINLNRPIHAHTASLFEISRFLLSPSTYLLRLPLKLRVNI